MKFKKAMAILMPLIMSAGFFSTSALTASAAETSAVSNASVMLSFDKEMAKGEKYTLNAVGNDLTYSSDNTNVAVVSESGVIEAVGSGTAVISAVNSKNDAVQVKITVSESIPMVFGDINNDGIVDGRDASFIMTYYAKTSTGYTGTLEQYKAELKIAATTTAEKTAVTTTTTTAKATTEKPVTVSTAPAENSDIESYKNCIEGKYLLWMDTRSGKNYVLNDKVVKLKIKIKEDIPNNDYTILMTTDLSCIEGISMYPDKLSKGTIRVGNGSIAPNDVSSENGFVIYGDNIACNQGDTIDYYLNFKNAPGLAASLIWFYYNKDVMDILSIEPVGDFADISKNGDLTTGSRALN